MLWGIKISFKTIAQQAASIRSLYPNFHISASTYDLRATGLLRPTARSETYTIQISYSEKESPDIQVLNPILVENEKGEPIPHIYDEKKLCLYHPLFTDFNYDRLISETILPWTSLWLYHYENWHMTGEWRGGGTHPIPKQ